MVAGSIVRLMPGAQDVKGLDVSSYIAMMAQPVKVSDELVLNAPLSAVLECVQTSEGREQLGQVLSARPYPRFEAVPDRPGLLAKIDKDGTRTLGRFVQRAFTAVEQR